MGQLKTLSFSFNTSIYYDLLKVTASIKYTSSTHHIYVKTER